MAPELKNIELEEGLDSIKFGMTKEALKKIAGEPDEIEEFSYSEEENDHAETWHYDELEMSVAFEEINEWRLSSIAVSSPDYLLEGKKLIGLNEKEVTAVIEELGLGEIEVEDRPTLDNSEQRVLSVEEVNLNLWFEEGLVSEVQWGPIWMDDDENLN
jgi:hypothetical protein